MDSRFSSRWRRGLSWAMGVIAALTVAVFAAWEFGALNGVAFWAAGRAIGYTVSCRQVSGGLLSDFTCTDLQLADAKGRFLQIGQFTLDWNPWALLGNEVRLGHMALADATLTRLPQGTSSSNEILPGMKISIGRLDVHRLVLAVADNRRACVNIGGKGTVGPQGFDTAFIVARCAPESGELNFRGRYEKSSGALDLSALGRDDGALIAVLTDIKSVGATHLALSASGTLAAFNGNFNLRADGIGHIDARFVARDLASTNLSASFQFVPALLPSWAPQGAGTLTASLARRRDGGFVVRSSALEWGGAVGKLQLASAANGTLDGKIALSMAKPTLISGLNIGALAVDATVAGTRTAPQLSGVAKLSKIANDGVGAASLQSNFVLASDIGGTTTVKLVGQTRGTTLPAVLSDLLGQSLAFHGTATRSSSGAIQFDAAVDGAAADILAKAEFGQSNGSGTVKLTIANLAAAGADLSGHATAELNLTRLTLRGDMDGTLSVQGAGITSSGFGAALGKSPALHATFHVAKGNYALDDLRIVTAAVAARGRVTMATDGTLAAKLQTTAGDLATLSALTGRALTGKFTLSVGLGGTAAAPTVSIAAKAPRVTVDKSVVTDASFQLDARKQAQWTAHLGARAATPSGGVDVLADAQTAPGGWHALVIKGSLGAARLTGELNKRGKAYSGRLGLSGDVLSPIGFFLDTPMSGSGTLSLVGDGKEIRFDANLKHVAAGPLNDAIVRGNAVMQGLTGPVTMSVSARDGANSVAASGKATLTPTVLTLQKLDGSWTGTRFALSSPTVFSMTDGMFKLERTAIDVSGGHLDLTAQGGGGVLIASARLSNMPVAPIASALQIGKAGGTLGLDLVVDMAPGKTQARLQVAAKNLLFASADKTAKPANVSLTAQWDGSMLTADGRISGLDSNDATLHARIPVIRPVGGYVPELAASGPVSAQLQAQLQVGRLMALLPVSEETASGTLVASAAVSGDIANPQFAGKITLTDGTFTDYETGTKLAKLNASIEAMGANKAVVNLSATDGGSGTAKADGEFSLAADRTGGIGRLTGHLNVNLANAEIVRDDLMRASVSGTLAIDRSDAGPPNVSGKLRTNTVRVDIGAAIPPEVPQIKVTHINGGPPAELPVKTTTSFLSAARLDVAVTMPNRIYVTGRGLDSEWKGNLAIGGTVGTPDLSGKFDLVRGQAELVGKTFTLRDGRVALDPTVKGNATVHIVAQNSESDVTVTVTADGPVADPAITWTSSPALPKSEILSRLFFGTSTPHLTAGQALQLAELSGQLDRFGFSVGGGGILSFARNFTGLDVLSVAAPSDLSGTGASVTAGKYVTDNVYVAVQQGANVSAGNALVEVKVTPHVTIDAEAGANSQGSLGVTWKWDY